MHLAEIIRKSEKEKRRKNYIDYTGNKFGKWTVISKTYQKDVNGKNRLYCQCRCECGIEKEVRLDGLLKGLTKNCIKCKEMPKKHGDYKTRLYNILLGMRARCYNIHNPEYKNYGGRGIKICDEWQNYLDFKKWALNNGYSDNLTIERIDVNGNYCPENCKWIPRSEQLKNTTKTIYITDKGETLCAMDWCKKIGISNNVLIKRYRSGMPIELVLSTKRYYGKSYKLVEKEYKDARC